MGYSPNGHKELNKAEQLSMYGHCESIILTIIITEYPNHLKWLFRIQRKLHNNENLCLPR